MTHQFVVMSAGKDHTIDYNGDGKINSEDDIVVHNIDGKQVGWRFLNENVKNKMKKIIDKDAKNTSEKKQRVVYQRVPNNEGTPVVIKDSTGFGQYVKQGAGMQLGRIAVDSTIDLFSSMFSEEGGGISESPKNLNNNLFRCYHTKCSNEYRKYIEIWNKICKEINKINNTNKDYKVKLKEIEEKYISLLKTKDSNIFYNCGVKKCNNELLETSKLNLKLLLKKYPEDKELKIINEKINKNILEKTDLKYIVKLLLRIE